MGKERIAYIDFMKGICIMLIVMGHVDDRVYDMVLPHLNIALRTIQIPLFFFLSGLFFKTYGGFSVFFRKKVNNLIVPLLFFHFFCCILRFPLVEIVHFFRPDIIEIQFKLSDVIPAFFCGHWNSAGALWFLVALFTMNILYYIFTILFKNVGIICCVFIASVLGCVLMNYKIRLPFELVIALVGLPYFMLGSFVKRLNMLSPSKYDKYGFIVFIPVGFVIYFFSKDINLFYQVIPDYFSLYVLPFIAILSLLWCCKCFRYVPMVCYYGRYSIIIVGTHQVLISYVWFALLGLFKIHNLALRLLTFVIVMLIELLLVPLLKKYFPKLTAQKEFFKEGWSL